MTALAAALPIPEVFYDPHTSGKCYYVKNSREFFIPVTEANLKRMLKGDGYSHETEEDEALSEIDALLNKVQKEKDVEYAGPLAGHATGHYTIQNRRVLVTEGPKLIEPVEGPWPTLEALLRGLLCPEGEVAWGREAQLAVFYSWLKVSITALRARKRRPGQVLVIAGPPACGKSLAQNLLTRLLGGRSAKPYQFLAGGTQFNSELFHAEHLMIEDETASFDLRTRRQLGANLKGFVVNESQRCHPKNRPALTLFPFWRVSITLNDEAENLMVLPPLDESLQDKMLLFRAYKRDMPMPTETLEQWAAFMMVLDAELPAFVHFLLHSWRIPSELRCQRYGVGHFHHPELLEMMNVLAPETKLLELIDAKLFPKSAMDPDEWEGKASELETELCATSSSVAHEARKLLLFNSACGQYLGRLAQLHPERISKRISAGYTIWKIQPPPKLD
ncbi:MAG: hypothetical protein QOE70_935 [Chthoniobacter sp.]|jgi:hypothetical protein|nr:hypothetical protein [Chthoniobacter sp.]